MFTYVIGLRDPGSKKHQNMVAAARALYKAGIHELPKDMKEYFSLSEPSEVLSDEMSGCIIEITDHISSGKPREGCDDWTVDLRTLPKDITHIRFTNSY
jgi:hypothetical protein